MEPTDKMSRMPNASSFKDQPFTISKGNIPVCELPRQTLSAIGWELTSNEHGADYKDFAKSVGYSVQRLVDCVSEGSMNPGYDLLNDWSTEPAHTVRVLVFHIRKINRFDIVKLLLNLLAGSTSLILLEEDVRRTIERAWTVAVKVDALQLAYHYRNHLERFCKDVSPWDQVQTTMEGSSFSYDCPETRDIKSAVDDVITRVVTGMGERHLDFQGAILKPIGSFGSGTRIGRVPNEFDYMLVLYGGRLKITRRPESSKRWAMCGEESLHARANAKEQAGERYQISVKAQVDSTLVSPLSTSRDVQSYDLWELFKRTFEEEFRNVSLPECLTHGGILTPNFSGVAGNPPAVTVSLVWKGQHVITADVAPGFQVSFEILPPDVARTVTKFKHNNNCPFPQIRWLCDYLVHIVPGRTEWMLTTAVMETAVLHNLGPLCPLVKKLRLLKLLSAEILSWMPQQHIIERSHLDTCSRFTADMKECLSASLMGKLQLPKRVEGEGGELIYSNRVALLLAANHREHMKEMGPEHDRGDCALCVSLETTVRMDSFSRIHPCLGEVLKVPYKPWVRVTSCALKYMVLGELLQEPIHDHLPPTKRSLDISYHTLLGFLERLASGEKVAHPILGPAGRSVDPISYNEGYCSEQLMTQHKSLRHQLVEMVRRLDPDDRHKNRQTSVDEFNTKL